MKEKKYEDRGLGVLSLKKKDDKARIQLIVRAATAVGSVLLNIMLTMEVKPIKTGTNNVQFVCYPNPPLPGVEGPTTILIRVKTSGDADELLEKMTQ